MKKELFVKNVDRIKYHRENLNEAKEMLIKVVLEENPHLKANEVEVHLIKNWKLI